MIEKFLDFEFKYNLLDEKIFGFCYWGYIRTKIYHKLFNSVEVKKSDKKQGFSSRIASYIDKKNSSSVMSLLNNKIRFSDFLYLLRNSTINHPLLHHKKYDILIFPSTRRTLIDGKYFAYWTDEICDRLEKRCICAESLDGTRHMRPYYTKKLLEIDVVDVYPVLFSGISAFFHFNLTNKIKKVAEELRLKINEIELSYL